MSETQKTPFVVKLHNATCPLWLLNIAFLKKIEPGCVLAAKHAEENKS